MRVRTLFGFMIIGLLAACSTGRDMTSPHYLPAWENKIINLPSPTETSGGYWTVKVVQKVSYGIGRVIVFPFAILGNVAVNAYYIPTWPLRWLFRGDKRLIVWYPIFSVGQEVGSDYFSKQWNRDLV